MTDKSRFSKAVAPKRSMTRRAAIQFVGTGLCSAFSFPRAALAWHATDMSGTLPSLNFTMTRASDGKSVTAADYKGKIALLYFGYTFCPDVCPTTLLNLTAMLKQLGQRADQVRVLFVTVDPHRDTLEVLKQYTAAFAPQIVGLRGSPDQLAALAKRCRVAYSVEPASKDHPYTVTHSSAVYVFDRNGNIKLLFSGLATASPNVSGYADDLHTLIDRGDDSSLWGEIVHSLF